MVSKKAISILRNLVFSDLRELQGTIQIEKLTEKIINESFAGWLEEKIELNGHSLRWVSLDDMGFISITFYDNQVTDERKKLVLKICNNQNTFEKL